MPAADQFIPELEQLTPLARWLRINARAIAQFMPLVGGPRSACERRVMDVADAVLLMAERALAKIDQG